ncbi:MAG: hypothetical protein AAGG51_13840 [Cyanobacteria bacterium P01_G01_bin.54]
MFLFPIGIGLTGGTMMLAAGSLGKVRNPAFATFFGLLTGLMIYGTMNTLGYNQFKGTVAQQLEAEAGQVSPSEIDRVVERFLQDEVSASGIWGYMKYEAKQGLNFRLSRRGRHAEFNIGATWTWIYWALELLIIELLIVSLAKFATTSPFCEPCSKWYDIKKKVGTVEPQWSENFLALFEQGQFGEAGRLIHASQATVAAGLELEQSCCPACQTSDVSFHVKLARLDEKGQLQLRTVSEGMMDSRNYQDLKAEIVDETPVAEDAETQSK